MASKEQRFKLYVEADALTGEIGRRLSKVRELKNFRQWQADPLQVRLARLFRRAIARTKRRFNAYWGGA